MSHLHRHLTPNQTPCRQTRRQMLWETGAGFTGLAMVDLLSREGFFHRLRADEKEKIQGLLAPREPHFKPRATRCVFFS